MTALSEPVKMTLAQEAKRPEKWQREAPRESAEVARYVDSDRGDFTAVLEAERDREETRYGIYISQAEGVAARAALWRALGRPQTQAR